MRAIACGGRGVTPAGVPCHLACRRYRLPFLHPARTAHGVWEEREGLLVRLENEEGRVGFGEVAPIPWFGTETLAEAEDALVRLEGAVEPARLDGVPERLGCVRFALAAARAGAAPAPAAASRLAVAALLPAGRAALAAADRAVAAGWVAFKWKVGAGDAADEQALLDDLLARLPGHAKLRLDANGAWNRRLAARWLARCADRPIEFVEQPCFAEPAATEAERRRTDDALRGLADDHPTPIALDESVAGLAGLRAWLERGWRGVVVIKPALVGAGADLEALLGSFRADVVFSSALETAVGRRAALRTAFRLAGAAPRALGFGVTPLFRETRVDGPAAQPFLSPADVEQMNPEAAWTALT